MKGAVRKWLLRKAKQELREARSDLKESVELVEEYENRVVDPSWNTCGAGPDPKRPGEETWGPMVKEHQRYARRDRAVVAMLEDVVKELSEEGEGGR